MFPPGPLGRNSEITRSPGAGANDVGVELADNVWHAENSDVFPAPSVAVAVIFDPSAMPLVKVNMKLALPPASVVTELWPVPRNTAPCPNPVESHAPLE